MPNQARQHRTNTAGDILDIAETLIQTRGYSAISYQDIADRLGIRKASIHYHFATKTELGVAVVARYRERFEEVLTAVAANGSLSCLEMFEAYTVPYLEFAGTSDRICLCGALAGEILALPPPVRDEVERNFTFHQNWLTRLMKRGVANEEFDRMLPPAKMARMILGALQGALLIKRATGNAAQVRDVIAVLKSQLRSSA